MRRSDTCGLKEILQPYSRPATAVTSRGRRGQQQVDIGKHHLMAQKPKIGGTHQLSSYNLRSLGACIETKSLKGGENQQG
eukprot:scaffold210048_cov14-Tisochrysis_lutea.AAC.1